MDILQIIKTRRSIRKYRDKSIADKLIAKILEAGRWAPSGLNNQPWRFMIVQNMVRKNQLAVFSKYSRIIKDSAALILVFADKRVIYNRDKDLMAIGASIQNMLLAACSLGIGACWLGEILSKKKEVANYVQIPIHLELMAVLSLGYSAEKVKKGKRLLLKNIILKGWEGNDHAK